MSKQFFLHMLAILSAIPLLFISIHTNAQPNPDTRYSKVDIFPERVAVKPGDKITIATQITLSDHWHVYWHNPGDSGLPVSIKWDLPEGFKISDINWPTPDKISYGTLVNYGYYNQVTLLQTLRVPDTLPQGKINLTANLDILVCNNICIPEHDKISIYLNNPNNLDTDNSEIITAARAKLPRTIKGQFFFRDENNLLHLSLIPENRTILSDATENNIDFFPYDWGIIKYTAIPKVMIKDGKLIIAYERGAEPIDSEKTLKGLLVIKGEIGHNRGYIVTAMPSGENAKPVIINKPNISSNNILASAQSQKSDITLRVHETKTITLLSAIILAFLGGLVLNLMPCVFPVLSIKALNLIEMKNQSSRQAKLHGLAYTIGVIFSFLFIAGALIAFKHAGAAIGWGFQLQNPLVVVILVYLFFLIGLNFLGLFEIGVGLTSIGNKFTKNRHSYTGSFFTGTLASVVATPCTAPFMGAAMGFALTQSAFVSLIVFAVLGLGLATPYLLLSFIPSARILLPKPDAWMETFKQFLAFPMFASSLWLIWVVSQQTGTTGIFLSLFGLLCLTFSIWLSKIIKTKKPTDIKTFITGIMAIAAITGVIYTLNKIHNLGISETTQNTTAKQETIPYTKETLAKLLSGDNPVFVEISAAWCITCKLNETAVINTKATRGLFKAKNVRHIVGDWTNRSTEITEYLNAYHRDGVPLYIYYGKRDSVTKMRKQAVILPQILTSSDLHKAIENL